MHNGLLLLGYLTLQRAIELVLARRHTTALFAKGAYEVGAAHYPAIVVLHASWLGTLWLFGWNRDLVLPWFAAFVVLRLQAVDRYHDIQLLEPAPVGWNNSEGAGHDLRMYSAAFQLRQEQFKLTISNQRIPAYKRDMKRLAFIDERKHSVDQFIALEVGKLTQLNSTSKMCRVERIAARTSEGAFLGDFNRERR